MASQMDKKAKSVFLLARFLVQEHSFWCKNTVFTNNSVFAIAKVRFQEQKHCFGVQSTKNSVFAPKTLFLLLRQKTLSLVSEFGKSSVFILLGNPFFL